MKKSIFTTLSIFIFAHAFAQQKWNYPETQKIPVYDTIWGKVLQDDYRWMEKTEDPKFVNWLKEQNTFSESVIDKIPNQDKIAASLKELMTAVGTLYGQAMGNDEVVIYGKSLATANATKIYYRNLKTNKERLLLDGETYFPGKIASFSERAMSDDGKYFKFNASEGGKENGKIRIMDLKTFSILPEELNGRVSAFININGKNYVAYTASDNDNVRSGKIIGRKIMLHLPGTNVTEDKTIADLDKNAEMNSIGKEYYLAARQQNNKDYIFLNVFGASNYAQVYYKNKKDIFDTNIPWKNYVIPEEKQLPLSQSHIGNDVYFLTSVNNPKYELRKSTVQNSKNSVLVYAPPTDWKINNVQRAKDYLVIQITKNELESKNFAYHLKSGKITELKTGLQGIVYITPLGFETNEATAESSSWTSISPRYSYNLDKRKLVKGIFYSKINLPENPYLVAEELEIPSHDGVLVPISVVYDRRYLKKDGSNICILYGYGAFGISRTPNYDLLPFLSDRGVIHVTAHVRGGGEKGDDWHIAGMKSNKHNSWKDMVAAAEYLIKNKYTSPEKLSLEGASAGGQLVGRALTYRPDLFRAAMVKVGVLNTMRGEFTPNPSPIGGEYGTLKDEKEAGYLYDADAYHQTKPGTKYPAQFITAGYNDPRVIVWQPAKYAAAMQSADVSGNPQLLVTEFEGGHFGGSGMDAWIKQNSQEIAFILWQCGDKDFQPKE
ncbi:MAG: prolyl oligopeptidase family serine peptidase [Flavobacteriaceae bacterium]|nr:prolyl oligopeptidase family serine peptidase [Flavobacteriaceae bacterium]